MTDCCYFSAVAMLVSLQRTPAWRPHAESFLHLGEASSNNTGMKNRTDLNLGETVYISIRVLTHILDLFIVLIVWKWKPAIPEFNSVNMVMSSVAGSCPPFSLVCRARSRKDARTKLNILSKLCNTRVNCHCASVSVLESNVLVKALKRLKQDRSPCTIPSQKWSDEKEKLLQFSAAVFVQQTVFPIY